MSTAAPVINMFWAYGDLSKLERLGVASFVVQGYKVKLWTYGKLTNAPKGVVLADANEILPEGRVFKNQTGSYASFSDLFRYKLLNERGGVYVDADIIALSGSYRFEQPLLVTERQDDSNNVVITNCIISNPFPARGNIIDLAYAVADRFPPAQITWGEIGPQLMTTLLLLQVNHGYEIKGPDFVNPFKFWNCPGALLSADSKLPEETQFLHCYSSWWDRTGTDKNMSYPAGSLMAEFEAKFGSVL